MTSRSPNARSNETTRDNPQQTVGSIMRPPLGEISEDATAAEGIDYVRQHASAELTYLYAIDAQRRLRGVVVLRDLFLAAPDQLIRSFMIQPAFYLTPDMTLLDAIRAVVGRHFPVYPVCQPDGKLLGLIRGYSLFENQVVTITAQAGKMVGVRAQEDSSTKFVTSLRLRLPWLGLNLALSAASALVLFLFKGTLAQFIILAIFLPVITTQGRNSGAQTMAITLRGLTSGQWQQGHGRRILLKESLLGLATGTLLGVIIAIAITLEEIYFGNPETALTLAVVVLGGMISGCLVSCALGVTVPLLLRRLGSDPALAAGILHSNVSSVFCQGLFLTLAWWLVM